MNDSTATADHPTIDLRCHFAIDEFDYRMVKQAAAKARMDVEDFALAANIHAVAAVAMPDRQNNGRVRR